MKTQRFQWTKGLINGCMLALVASVLLGCNAATSMSGSPDSTHRAEQTAEPLDSFPTSMHSTTHSNHALASVSTSPPPTVLALTPNATPPAASNQIAIDNFAFKPATLTVAAGTTVTWVNQDDVPHTATASVKPRAFDSGTLDTDQKYSFTFKTPGTYAYFCAVHPHMTGQIVVK